MKHYTVIITYLTVALFASGCSKQNEGDKAVSGQPSLVRGAILETVKSAAVSELLDVVGNVRARTSAVVSTRIPGTVSVLRVREGDRVKKGQLLAQLDAGENQANAAVADATIDEARRGLDEALSRKKLADSTFERYHNLLKEQAVSRQEFDVRKAEKDMAAQAVARGEAKLKQSEAGAKAATTMSGYTRIIAPISGIITSRQADLGATVFPGQPLMTIEDEGSYQLELALPENAATKVKPGTSLRVTLDALGSSFVAKITEIVPTTDTQSRTFVAKIPLNQNGLKSGMFGRGAINLGTTVNALTVPKKAVMERGAMATVWIVDAQNIARMRIIKSGRQTGDLVEVLAGLTDGERIVVGGIEKITEGARVE